MQVIKRGRDIVINPKVHLRTLIWLHGLGDSAEGFLPLFQMTKVLDDCKYVLLTAPSRPVSINDGAVMNSWYDIKNIETRELNDEAEESALRVAGEVEEERKHAKEVYLGGFSQGGAISLFTGLVKLERPLNGIIGMSCYGLNYSVKESLKGTPVLLYHGLDDLMIPVEYAEKSFEKSLKDVKYQLFTEPHLGHGVSLAGLDKIKKWAKSLYLT